MKNLVPIVAILAGVSIPILGILSPIIPQLVPLAYVITVFCLGTVCGRYLLGFHHELRMKELEKQTELAHLDAAKYEAAEKLIASDDAVEKAVKRVEANQATTKHSVARI